MARTKTVQGELVVDEIAIRSEFKFDETAVVSMKQIVQSIAIVDKKSFDEAWEIRQDLRSLRVGIDKERKRLTEKARSYTDMVNGVAKSILSHIVPVEEMVIAKVDHYETEQAEKKKAAELAKQQALQKRLDALAAVGHIPNQFLISIMPEEEFQVLLAEETTKHSEKLAREEAERIEAKRVADEEAKRLESERLELEAKRKAERLELDRQRKENEEQQAALVEQRNKMEAEARLQREEIARQRKEIEDKQAEANRIESERLARLQREKDRIEAEGRAKAEYEHWLAKAEVLKPDIEKLKEFAKSLRLIAYPIMATEECARAIEHVKERMDDIADYCEGFVS